MKSIIYANILLKQFKPSKNIYCLKSPAFYESLIFIISEIIKVFFPQEESDTIQEGFIISKLFMLLVNKELNRLFRSNKYNLFSNQKTLKVSNTLNVPQVPHYL